jgi:uncharacterized protein
MDIKHIELSGRGAFIVKGDGRRLAEMTYSKAGDTAIIIDHTEVDESLRGQKVGDKLLAAAVDHARAKGLKIFATCPFALRKLKANAKYADVFGG